VEGRTTTSADPDAIRAAARALEPEVRRLDPGADARAEMLGAPAAHVRDLAARLPTLPACDADPPHADDVDRLVELLVDAAARIERE